MHNHDDFDIFMFRVFEIFSVYIAMPFVHKFDRRKYGWPGHKTTVCWLVDQFFFEFRFRFFSRKKKKWNNHDNNRSSDNSCTICCYIQLNFVFSHEWFVKHKKKRKNLKFWNWVQRMDMCAKENNNKKNQFFFLFQFF